MPRSCPRDHPKPFSRKQSRRLSHTQHALLFRARRRRVNTDLIPCGTSEGWQKLLDEDRTSEAKRQMYLHHHIELHERE